MTELPQKARGSQSGGPGADHGHAPSGGRQGRQYRCTSMIGRVPFQSMNGQTFVIPAAVAFFLAGVGTDPAGYAGEGILRIHGEQGVIHPALGQQAVHLLNIVARRTGGLAGGRTILAHESLHADNCGFPFLAVNGRHN